MWGKKRKFVEKEEKRRKVVKKKEKVPNKWEISSQVLVVEGRVQKFEFDPKSCLNLPFVFKNWFLHAKVNSKCWFHCFTFYFFKTFVFPYLSLLANSLSLVTTLNFNLDCYVFQYVEFEIGMSIWCHWFSHLSSSIPFMRSYLYTCY